MYDVCLSQLRNNARTPPDFFHRQDWTEERAKDAAESVKRFAGFDLFVGNIPFSVSEKARGVTFSTSASGRVQQLYTCAPC